jgi:hypothetical protein
MSSVTILIIGMGVFGLLLVGLFLTVIEFQSEATRPDLMVGVQPKRMVDEHELEARGSTRAATGS